MIPFESKFCEDAPETIEQQLLEKRFPVDRNFDDKIPDIIQALAWVLLEHRKVANKCVEPDKVKVATAYYKKRSDIYRQFIDESIVESKNHKLSLIEIYRSFKDWHKESLPGVAIPVKNDMKEYLIKYWGDPSKGTCWEGFRINNQDLNDQKQEDEQVDEQEALLL